jgi:hypothetical protein
MTLSDRSDCLRSSHGFAGSRIAETGLERDPEPQTDRATAIDALLREGGE